MGNQFNYEQEMQILASYKKWKNEKRKERLENLFYILLSLVLGLAFIYFIIGILSESFKLDDWKNANIQLFCAGSTVWGLMILIFNNFQKK